MSAVPYTVGRAPFPVYHHRPEGRGEVVILRLGRGEKMATQRPERRPKQRPENKNSKARKKKRY